MDITKCLYHASNNRFTDPWENIIGLKKNFDYIGRTFTAKKYEPPRPTYMRLDSTGREDDRAMEREEMKVSSPNSNNCKSGDMKGPGIMGGGTPTKPKRSRGGFVSIFQFWGGFVGTKSLNSARTQPSPLRDIGRPTFNVGSIFEMYQESCLVEDSIRNCRRLANERDKTNLTCCSVPKADSEEVHSGVEVFLLNEPVSGEDKIEVPCETLEDIVITVNIDMAPSCAPESASLQCVGQNASLANIALPADQDVGPMCSENKCVTNNSSSSTLVGVPEALETSSCVNVEDDLIKCKVGVENNIDSNEQCDERALKHKRWRSGNSRMGSNASASVPLCSEQQCNLKNKLLTAPYVTPSHPDGSYNNSITKPVDFILNTETLSQKRVNDHAVSKTQKRSRKRSRRKARRQRKNCVAPQNNSVPQQTTTIPNTSAEVGDSANPCPKASTPSLDEVDAVIGKPVATPICFVQPLCANAAIAFILGVCSDDSESEDDDGYEWEVGGDDNWQKSNELWESFQQCAQLHLSNLKSPVITASTTCDSAATTAVLCNDVVDGVCRPTEPQDAANSHEHLSREYPNANQLTSEQLSEVNRRWLNEVEEDGVPCDKRNNDKKVHFAEGRDLQQVRRLCTWSYAHQAARKGEWEQYARDRARFRTRIQEVEKSIGYIFSSEHRTSVYQKYFESSSC